MVIRRMTGSLDGKEVVCHSQDASWMSLDEGIPTNTVLSVSSVPTEILLIKKYMGIITKGVSENTSHVSLFLVRERE